MEEALYDTVESNAAGALFGLPFMLLLWECTYLWYGDEAALDGDATFQSPGLRAGDG